MEHGIAHESKGSREHLSDAADLDLSGGARGARVAFFGGRRLLHHVAGGRLEAAEELDVRALEARHLQIVPSGARLERRLAHHAAVHNHSRVVLVEVDARVRVARADHARAVVEIQARGRVYALAERLAVERAVHMHVEGAAVVEAVGDVGLELCTGAHDQRAAHRLVPERELRRSALHVERSAGLHHRRARHEQIAARLQCAFQHRDRAEPCGTAASVDCDVARDRERRAPLRVGRGDRHAGRGESAREVVLQEQRALHVIDAQSSVGVALRRHEVALDRAVGRLQLERVEPV